MWYVVHTKPREEFRALDQLERQGFDAYLPTWTRERISWGSLSSRVEPLFSRYLFVRLASANQNFSLIRSTRGVSGLVSFGHHPSRLSEEAVIGLRELEQSARQLAKGLFEPGQLVKIFSGPLRGLEGVFKGRTASDRGLVLIDFLSKSHTVSVPIKEILPHH
jgi:transcriptional antiterminator RfaH